MNEVELDISHIRLGERPLIVCDVDDVVLQFIDPFQLFLQSLGHEFLPRSFRLHGNIVSKTDGSALDEAHISRLIEEFFAAQEEWQTPLDRAVQTLDRLSQTADILFLTAMPPRYQDQRRRLLDRTGLTFPLLASERPKGPIVQALHASRPLPVIFIDDMVRNLHSVRDHVADSLLIHLMPELARVTVFAPAADEGATRATDWQHAADLIEAHILQHAAMRRTDPAA